MNRNTLYRLTEMIEKLQRYSGREEKESILRQYPDMKNILSWAYNPNINFYITGKNIIDNGTIGLTNLNSKFQTIEELLISLSGRRITGNLALDHCSIFITKNIKYKDTIIKILNRDLRCGISSKTINKVWKDLIPEFNIPLANTYDPNKHSIFDGKHFISRKLDGIRCLCFIESTGITFITRKGKEIFTLDKIKQEIHRKWEYEGDIILDGELCIIEDGVEKFSGISSLFRRKEFTIEDPLFYVFDYYSIYDFNHKTDNFTDYKIKYSMLKKQLQQFNYIRVLDHIFLENSEQLQIPSGWEGFIIRNNTPTEFKRSDNLLKVKEFFEEEFEVLGIKHGVMRIEGEEQETCGSLLIKYKNNIVEVGSGLNQDQRLKWIQDPNRIIGKTITVKYFSESIDKEGNISLRFPIFKGIRKD